MTNLQEYLNSKYPTAEDKEQVKRIDLGEINEERKSQGNEELLEGGELNLSEFKKLEEFKISRQYLSTPLIKIETGGLTNLKELIWKSSEITEDSEENKNLWEELGIKEDAEKQKAVKEIKKISGLFASNWLNGKKVNIYFATEKAPKEQLKDKNGITEIKEDSFDIYLNLERKDKDNKFASELVRWIFAQELAHILVEQGRKDGKTNYDKEFGLKFTPLFWNHLFFAEKSTENLVRTNAQEELLLSEENASLYLTNPDFKQFYQEFLEQETTEDNLLEKQITINEQLFNKAWRIIGKEIINLTSQELNKGLSKEETVKLWTKLTLSKISGNIKVNYHKENPFVKQIEELMFTVPLKLELEQSKQINEELKKEKEQLPNPENFNKLTKQNKEWQNYLGDFTSEEDYEKISKKIETIK